MKMGMRGAVASLVVGMMLAAGQAQAQAPAAGSATTTLSSEKQKVSYAIGMDVARSFEPIAQDIDVNALQRRDRERVQGRQAAVVRRADPGHRHRAAHATGRA